MDRTKLFYMLSVIANIEILVAFLPEMSFLGSQPARHSLFQRLDGVGDERAGSLLPHSSQNGTRSPVRERTRC